MLTGPFYEIPPEPELPHANEPHTVPSGYWKIIIMKEGTSLRVAAFIMDQDTPRSSPLQDHVVKVKDVQTKSKLNFFWELLDTVETELEDRQDAAWIIGSP